MVLEAPHFVLVVNFIHYLFSLSIWSYCMFTEIKFLHSRSLSPVYVAGGEDESINDQLGK